MKKITGYMVTNPTTHLTYIFNTFDSIMLFGLVLYGKRITEYGQMLFQSQFNK
jgi:hypothetical protein